MKAIIYVILPTNSIEFPQHSMVEIFLWNDSYVTTSLSNTSNVGKSIVYGAYNKIENVWRLYYCNRSIHRGQNPGNQYLYFIFWFLKLVRYRNSF